MRSWNLPAGSPLSLTLAAFCQTDPVDYCNDQVWELQLGAGDPPAIALYTTFGLRARSMRLFPRFIHKNKTLSDPSKFHQPPRFHFLHPGHLLLSCSPFAGFEVDLEYWATSSQTIAGQIRLTNRSILKDSMALEMIGLLSPLDQGEGMVPVLIDQVNILKGKTDLIVPVLFMTGSPHPTSGAFPGLTVTIELFPGNSQKVNWALASLNDQDSSFATAQQTTGRPWDAEISRIQRLAESRILEIHTGDSDWDSAFALTQKVALELFLPGNRSLPNPSFVGSRTPDDGFSERCDGSDYRPHWTGQTALDAYYLSDNLLPGSPDLVDGLLRNFLDVQEVNGDIDFKPGLGGQRTGQLAQPILCSLAWKLQQHQSDPTALGAYYPRLLQFLKSWFQPDHDQDQDGFPEWQHPIQTGLEDLPIYDGWYHGSQGTDISTIECPGLGAMLFNECQSLKRIARRIGTDEGASWLEEKSQILLRAVEDCWDEASGTYRYRDYQTHHSPKGQLVGYWAADGRYPIDASFSAATRLTGVLESHQETTISTTVTLNGIGTDGRPILEEIPIRQWQRTGRQSHFTTRNIFSSIQKVNIFHLSGNARIGIYSPDYTQEDITLLLPLWAGIPSPDRARKLVEKGLFTRLNKRQGLSTSSAEDVSGLAPNLAYSSPLWVSLVGDGLLRYGFERQAVQLFTRQMQAIISVLKKEAAFRQNYHAQSGLPIGERNSLRGLAPLGLFLKILGFQQLTPMQVAVAKDNPFSWPVHLKFRGMEIHRTKRETLITFFNGQKAKLRGPDASIATNER